MGKYYGNDGVSVYLNLNISKGSKGMLELFEDKEKSRVIDVWIKDDKIEKFYFNDLDIDLKDHVSDEVAKYLINYYEANGNVLEEAELDIKYSITGYYNPGKTSGPPEDCYPPEGDEERNVDSASLLLDKDVRFEIPQKYMTNIWDAFQDEIHHTWWYKDPLS